MSNLAIVVFEGRHTADEALLRLRKMEMDWDVGLDDVIVVSSDKDGRIRISQSADLPAMGMVGGGALGALTGTLIGAMVGNPAAGMVAGMAGGTGTGLLAGLFDQDDEQDALIEKIGAHLKPDCSALGVIAWTDRPGKLLNELEGLNGKVIQTTLSVADENALRAALNKT